MKYEIYLTPLAEQDILNIHSYIAIDNQKKADEFIIRLGSKVKNLEYNPGIGMKCDEIRKGLRRYVYGNYLIFYRIQKRHVEIVRIIHGVRDLEGIFKH